MHAFRLPFKHPTCPRILPSCRLPICHTPCWPHAPPANILQRTLAVCRYPKFVCQSLELHFVWGQHGIWVACRW